MRLLLIVSLVIISFSVNGQEIRKENLTKKKLFYYGGRTFNVESEGYYYKDPLGETTLRHGKWRFFSKEGDLLEERTYYKNDLHGPTIVYHLNGVKATEGYFERGVQDSIYIERHPNDSIKQKGFYTEGKPSGTWKYYYRDGRLKMVEEIIDQESFVWEFYQPDSLHTQTVTEGDGYLSIFYTNGNLKEEYFYENGMKQGPFKEGSVYGYYLLRGNFKENKRDGKWEYFYYTGDLEKISHYQDGQLHGDFKHYYDNGELRVEGNYKEGQKDGYWKWYTNSGETDMEGHFKKGEQHGDWKYYFPDGKLSYSASFKEGDRHGEWEYFYKDGSKFKIGNFEDDKKNGLWETWYESGKLLMTGNYKDDLEEGEWKNFWENGQLKNKSTFTQGKLDGEWLSFYPSGKPKLTGAYDMEMKTGEWKNYFDNGKLKDVENYKVITTKSKIKYGPMKGRKKRKSVKHGEFISYSSKDYRRTQEGTFKNGEKHGEWIAYHPGGKLPAVITTYKKGELHGPMRTYSFRGNRLLQEVNYKDGLQDGKVTIYNKRGEVIKVEEYEKGLKKVEGTSFTPPGR